MNDSFRQRLLLNHNSMCVNIGTLLLVLIVYTYREKNGSLAKVFIFTLLRSNTSTPAEKFVNPTNLTRYSELIPGQSN